MRCVANRDLPDLAAKLSSSLNLVIRGCCLCLQPTNHLDFPAVLWLEDYLNAYKKTLVRIVVFSLRIVLLMLVVRGSFGADVLPHLI
jgi:hypothetical protein